MGSAVQHSRAGWDNAEQATQAALADANTRKFVTGEPKK